MTITMKQKIIVHDKMQDGYVYWRTEPVGRHFAPAFAPELTPKGMLRLGVFGGKYMTDCRDEFPTRWFDGAKLCAERHDARLNYFGVNASQSLAVWRRNGWIRSQDPRGWFQWYCRYCTWAGVLQTTRDRSGDGVRSDATRRRCGRTASRAISIAAPDKDRRYCIGRTTAGRYDGSDAIRRTLTDRMTQFPVC